MRLIIVRHGETSENARHIFMGHRQGTLNAKGRAQARTLARKLKGYRIDAVFSSDLRRAADTTRQIMRYHGGVPVHYTRELREQHLGSLQGKRWGEWEATKRVNGASETRFKPPGGESTLEQRDRVRKFFRNLYKQYGSKTVLISAHAGIAWCLVSIYLGVPLGKTKGLVPRNCGVLVMDVDGSRGKVASNTMFAERL